MSAEVTLVLIAITLLSVAALGYASVKLLSSTLEELEAEEDGHGAGH